MDPLDDLQHATEGRLGGALSTSPLWNKTYKHTRKHKFTKCKQCKKTKHPHSQRSQTQMYAGHLHSYAKAPRVQEDISSVPGDWVCNHIKSPPLCLPRCQDFPEWFTDQYCLAYTLPSNPYFCFNLQICSDHSLGHPWTSESTEYLPHLRLCVAGPPSCSTCPQLGPDSD